MAFDIKAAENQVRAIMGEVFPATSVEKVEVRPGANFEGEPSLFVKILMAERPNPQEMKDNWSVVMDKLRSWLAVSAEDERFPYINFTTPADEREIADQPHD